MARFTHRSATIAVMAALIIGTLALGNRTTKAQGTSAPGTWESSINLQNVGAGTATVRIRFFGAAGAEIHSHTVTIPRNGALSVFVPAEVTGLPDGEYSAVVESNEPVKATVNTGSTNSATAPWSAFGYEGVGAGEVGSTLYFPGLYKSYYSFNSEMVIQNAGSNPATLKATFYNTANGDKLATANLGTVQPNASRTIDLATLSASPALPTHNAGLFSAVVTSNEGGPLAGIANIWRTGTPAGTASYNGFTSGSGTLFAAALYNDYFDFVSALTVQNIGEQRANVTITYSNGVVDSFILEPNASKERFQPGNARLPEGDTQGVFSARVTSTTEGAELVALTSLGKKLGSGGGELASYNVPMGASNQVNIPNVLDDYYGYFTAVTVQNTCDQRTDITISYPGGKSQKFANVAANGTINIIHLSGANAGSVLPNGTTTSAVVSASNSDCRLVAVLQHGTAPQVHGYNPAKQPSDYLLALTGSPK